MLHTRHDRIDRLRLDFHGHHVRDTSRAQFLFDRLRPNGRSEPIDKFLSRDAGGRLEHNEANLAVIANGGTEWWKASGETDQLTREVANFLEKLGEIFLLARSVRFRWHCGPHFFLSRSRIHTDLKG